MSSLHQNTHNWFFWLFNIDFEYEPSLKNDFWVVCFKIQIIFFLLQIYQNTYFPDIKNTYKSGLAAVESVSFSTCANPWHVSSCDYSIQYINLFICLFYLKQTSVRLPIPHTQSYYNSQSIVQFKIIWHTKLHKLCLCETRWNKL